MKIAIIGAGIAGLATATRLAAMQHEVTVFEALPYPGGKLSEFKSDDFRFDAGPSLFTMPQYVDELFVQANRNPRDYFSYQKLNTLCHYFWEDGTRLDASADIGQFAKDASKLFNEPESNIINILKDSKQKYELTGKTFLENSLHLPQTWLTKQVAFALTKLHRLDIFSNMDAVNKKHLNHPKLIQLFNRYATYNGSNPYKAPGILNIIPHFEFHYGAWFPQGGMYAIAMAITKLATELGVQFNYNHKVDKILYNNGKITGLRSKENDFDFDLVVSNMDMYFTYKKLLPAIKAPSRAMAQEKSSSALIFYWNINKQFPELNLHNILFSNDYQNEFAQLAKGNVCDDPTIYINISQKCQPADAPSGCENWFTMINVPHDNAQDWEAMIPMIREQIILKINRMLNTNIKQHISGEAILDPKTIESKTSSHRGALYGSSSNNRMAAFIRHANFSGKLKGLYFCGGSVHPGGGIPLCLLSAKIVSELIAKGH